jgi:hypothetical protein
MRRRAGYAALIAIDTLTSAFITASETAVVISATVSGHIHEWASR